MSQIITFYSYKGGVGRSMALANVATLLSKWGKKVLMIDWDLEAPGLEKFFEKYTQKVDWSKQRGVLEWLYARKEGKKAKWQDWVVSFKTEISTTDLHLLPSGKATEQYSELLRDFDVTRFYEQHDGGNAIEQFREELLSAYDYILIDSRTGVTDFGGICTIQLPDIVVMLYTPTEQGLMGTKKIAQRILDSHDKLPFDRFRLLICPVPSRFDSNTEFQESRKWLERFSAELAWLYDEWLPAETNLQDFLQILKIPYVSYFSFGEKLPVIEQGMSDPAGLGYAYENLAMLIGREYVEMEDFIERREVYLEKASGQASTVVAKKMDLLADVTVSIFSYNNDKRSALKALLQSPSIEFVDIEVPKMVLGMKTDSWSYYMASAFGEALNSDVCIFIVDPDFKFATDQLHSFYDSSIEKQINDSNKLIIPLYFRLPANARVYKFFTSRQGVLLSDDNIPEDVIEKIIEAMKYASKQKWQKQPAAEHTSGPTAS